jgi:hypothetical protein
MSETGTTTTSRFMSTTVAPLPCGVWARAHATGAGPGFYRRASERPLASVSTLAGTRVLAARSVFGRDRPATSSRYWSTPVTSE